MKTILLGIYLIALAGTASAGPKEQLAGLQKTVTELTQKQGTLGKMVASREGKPDCEVAVNLRDDVGNATLLIQMLHLHCATMASSPGADSRDFNRACDLVAGLTAFSIKSINISLELLSITSPALAQEGRGLRTLIEKSQKQVLAAKG